VTIVHIQSSTEGHETAQNTTPQGSGDLPGLNPSGLDGANQGDAFPKPPSSSEDQASTKEGPAVDAQTQCSSGDNNTPEVPHWYFPETTGWNPTDTENYYICLPGNPKLVAGSRPGSWRRQHDNDNFNLHNIFVAERHSALRDALESKNMRCDLLAIVSQSQAFVSLGFFRIGPLNQKASLSITLLITVKPGLVTFAQARDMIIDIEKLCIA
jgi:hypothetical protein